MPNKRKLYVIAYDVSANRQRGKLARRLEKRATRVQGSVFEAHLTRRGAEVLARQLQEFLGQSDSLRFYPVSDRSIPGCITIGSGPRPHSGDYWIL